VTCTKLLNGIWAYLLLLEVTELEGDVQPGVRSVEVAAEYEVGVPAVIGSNIGRDT